MKQFRWVLLFGVALPTLLLGWGWYASAAKERRALESAREADAIRTADAVRAAVDESLDELRERESRRPFYLYSYYYSPPDALALEDPVLVSPLSKLPEDPRLLGYFSIEPGGRVSTPHDRDEVAANVVARLDSAELEGLRDRVGGFEDNTVTRTNEFVAQQAVDLKNAAAGDMLLNARLVEQGRKNPVSVATVIEEPMAWHAAGDQILLQRVVRDEGGVETLQGVMLRRDYVLSHWLPRILGRHADASVVLVAADEAAACHVRRPASAALPLADLCFTQLPGSPAGGPWQLGALFGLLCIVMSGVYVVHRGSRRADELAAQKSRFVSEVTHELRTPLTTMRMHAEMLRDGLVSEERLSKVHHELAEESVRLNRLVDNVLELSRLEGGPSLERRSADLAACVARAAESRRDELDAAGLELVIDVPAERRARFDAVAVERVVLNLLENAEKYAAGSNPAIVVVELEGDAIVVRDHGPGIPAAERESVFERFHRAGDPTDVAGTGIGLALVRDIARAHEGDAVIVPTESGCAVRVTLG